MRMEPRLRDHPFFANAPVLPDSAFTRDLWGFNSWLWAWDDFKERRRQRRAAVVDGAVHPTRTPSSSTSQKPSAT
jgi:hypothetical protein